MRKALICIVASMLLASQVQAGPAEDKGLEIAKEADKRDTGFGDAKAGMTMILKNKSGQAAKRKLRIRTLEGKQQGDKSLIIFDSPGDVKGTALLTYTHKRGNDDQWLYLPALKRVKRISSANQSGPFVGSEFAYEDFNSQEVEKYNYKYLRNEKCKGGECFVLERYPVNKNSGYKRQVVWMDTNEYRVWKIDFYDRKGSHLKTLNFSDYKQYLDQYWRPHTMEMTNHVTGKGTDILWEKYIFRNGYNDNDFNKASLKRAR